MNKKIFLFIFFIISFLINSCFVLAQEENEKVTVNFFYSTTCPHCTAERQFLAKLEQRYPEIEIKQYVINKKENVELFEKIAKEHGATTQWVPATFICDDYIVGFIDEETTGKEIEEKIKNCLEHGCAHPNEYDHENGCVEDKKNIIPVPILGEIDLAKTGLPLLTIVLGFLDGLNPCAIWVLCFLLTLLIYAKSRKKMFLIGSIFIAASGIVYFLFMAAWLNFFLIIGFVDILRIIIAFIAIIVGIVNMKDFFFFKKGISFTIPERFKPKLFEKMRNLVKEEATLAIIIGTVVLAFAANSFELLCTFGFPAIYTRALTLHNLPTFTYYFYLALYNIVYVMPLFIIVLIFTSTMGARKFTEKHGKILKMISGILMFTLGLILLIKPEMLLFG